MKQSADFQHSARASRLLFTSGSHNELIKKLHYLLQLDLGIGIERRTMLNSNSFKCHDNFEKDNSRLTRRFVENGLVAEKQNPNRYLLQLGVREKCDDTMGI